MKHHKLRGYNPDALANFIHRSCTTKTRYATEEEAEFEADIRFISYYECQFCKGWHLTHTKDES